MVFNRVRIVLLAVFCLSLALVVTSFLIRSLSQETTQTPEKPVHASKADLTVKSIRLVEDRGGRTEWELEADSSETFQKKNLTVLKNVKATFYPEGQPVIYVEGREGRLRMDTKDMVIRGDVVVHSESGYALKTQKLSYDAQKRQVDTDKPVEMAQAGLTVKGVGLSANLDGKKLTVWRDVKATFQ